MTDTLGVALIGTGFMGKCHALAYNAVKPVFGTVPKPRLEVLCDVPLEAAKGHAEQFGFQRATDDWRSAIADPHVDVVSITTPNKLHKDMVLAAAAAGKHIWCEKPLATTLADAHAMTDAVARAGVASMIGYNFTKNPTFRHARKLVEDGAIGRPIHFRGVVDEDYCAAADTPWTWRSLIAEAGLGTLGDLGCHLVSLAVAIMGPVESLVADMETVYPTRPKPGSTEHGPVENEDIASALVRFESGVSGVLLTSRAAWGAKNRISLEIHGTEGMITFEQERLNELRLYRDAGDRATQGFTTILAGPQHPPYAAFLPAPGHSLGFQDQKTIECAAFLRAASGGPVEGPDIAEALNYERVIYAIAESARTGERVQLTG